MSIYNKIQILHLHYAILKHNIHAKIVAKLSTTELELHFSQLVNVYLSDTRIYLTFRKSIC